MVDDIPAWSPDDHLDRVYARGRALRRRRTRLLRAAPLGALAAVLLATALLGAGGSDPGRQLRVAGAANQPTITLTTIEGTAGTDPIVVPGATTTTTTEAPNGRTTTTVRAVTTVALARTTTTGANAAGSGVSGTVVFGPQCPVQRADQPCPDKPGPADVQLQRAGGSVVGRAHAGDDGRFAIAAPPGHYTVVATSSSSMGGCQPADATVSSGRYTDVTVSCDTGIR